VRITIALPQVDDVLKSLVALDATGQVLGLTLVTADARLLGSTEYAVLAN
jgi:hypothetical protein